MANSSSVPLPAFNSDASLTYTQPPHPAWKMGDGVPDVEAEWIETSEPRKTWDTSETPSSEIYRLLLSSIIPRPVAFVSSLSADEVPNLAPFSFFSMVSSNPALVSISIGSKEPYGQKDTRANILATKEFTVNIISEAFIEAATIASTQAPPEVDEWILSGLTTVPSMSVKPPYVKESAISMECELYSYQNIIPPNSTEISNTLVLGHIKKVHIRRSVLREDGLRVDPSKLRPVARLGSSTYSRLVDVYDLPTKRWATVEEEYQALLRDKNSHLNTT